MATDRQLSDDVIRWIAPLVILVFAFAVGFVCGAALTALTIFSP